MRGSPAVMWVEFGDGDLVWMVRGAGGVAGRDDVAVSPHAPLEQARLWLDGPWHLSCIDRIIWVFSWTMTDETWWRGRS